jgi:hypothetical protein
MEKINPCFNCGYNWQEPWESFPTCHYEGPHEWSPCEAADEANRIAREEAEYEEFIKSIEEEYCDDN